MIQSDHLERLAVDLDHFVDRIRILEQTLRHLVIDDDDIRPREIFGIREIASRDDVAALGLQPAGAVAIEPRLIPLLVLVLELGASTDVTRNRRDLGKSCDSLGFLERDRRVTPPRTCFIGAIANRRETDRPTIHVEAGRSCALEILCNAHVDAVDCCRQCDDDEYSHSNSENRQRSADLVLANCVERDADALRNVEQPR